MIAVRFAGLVIPTSGSVEAQALELLTKVVNGYGVADELPPQDMREGAIEGRVEIHLTSNSAHGLFMPVPPPGEARRQLYLIVADRLRLAVSEWDDVKLADQLDMALVRKYRELVAFVTGELTVTIPARQLAQLAA